MDNRKIIISAAAAALVAVGIGLGFFVGKGHTARQEKKQQAAIEKAEAEAAAAVQQAKRTAVTMVAYEQDLGKRPVIYLRNNTDQEITKCSYSLVYYGLDGMQLDVQTFNQPKNILPGDTLRDAFTLKLGKRKYVYAGSAEDKGDATPYRVEFQLLDYRSKSKE